ncbi:hypothetical protein [Streptomyces mirabilis]
MIAVTAEQLEQAETEAADAERERSEAERAYAAGRASSSAYERHQGAEAAAHHAVVRARAVRADWEAQRAAREARAAAGEAAAREMAGEVERLAASREAAVGAVALAVAAMGRALAVLGEHDRLVRAAGAALEVRGLRSAEDESTGVNLDGSARIGGVKWPLVDGASVLGLLLSGEVAGVLPRHPLARVRWAPYGGVTAAEGRDAVLDLVRAERGR